MKALILNSGIGKRMGPLTEERPKCLVEIDNGVTILSLQIKLLTNAGIREFIITTGPFSEKLEEYVNRMFPAIKAAFVHNPDYADTNYIYSMYLAKHLLKQDDFLLLHGDIFTEDRVCTRLINCSEENAVTIKHQFPLPQKDFKARIRNSIITDISIHTFGDDCVFLLPFYKLSARAMALWMKEIETSVEKNVRDIYAENVLSGIYRDLSLYPVDAAGMICMEIDTPGDLKQAQNLYRTGISESHFPDNKRKSQG